MVNLNPIYFLSTYVMNYYEQILHFVMLLVNSVVYPCIFYKSRAMIHKLINPRINSSYSTISVMILKLLAFGAVMSFIANQT